ncbi:hypothetical protein ST47_g6 [Ascochyta rabiei]|uniref:Uncharacterized protein n=1 Tax=Didymella rabiei TaxID=5454 RepID=A0A163MLX4_DIDRA|nr:hypothetical protein ST47_g6 [Ascochyta rabiei]
MANTDTTTTTTTTTTITTTTISTTISNAFTTAETGENWATTALSALDVWCGSTCHVALRCVLRSLLLVVLVGAFASVLLRSLGWKRRMQLIKATGLIRARSMLEESDMGRFAGTFMSAQVGAKKAKAEIVDGRPDVQDSCVLM